MNLDYLFNAAEVARMEYAEKDGSLKLFVFAFRKFFDEFRNSPTPRFELAKPSLLEVESKLSELEDNPDPPLFWRAWENARERVRQYDAANGYKPALEDADDESDAGNDARIAAETVARIADQEPDPVDGAPDYETDVADELDAAIQAGEAPRSIAARLGLDVEQVKARMDAFSVQPKSKKRRVK